MPRTLHRAAGGIRACDLLVGASSREVCSGHSDRTMLSVEPDLDQYFYTADTRFILVRGKLDKPLD